MTCPTYLVIRVNVHERELPRVINQHFYDTDPVVIRCRAIVRGVETIPKHDTLTSDRDEFVPCIH